MRLAAALLVLWATGTAAQTIVGAEYADPTSRYAHGILGDAIEWGALRVTTVHDKETEGEGQTQRMRHRIEKVLALPLDHVFEDVAPRLWDLDGDGAPEIVVVETDMAKGAALAVYGPSGKIAETPHIGRTNRWLAPIGAADLDGDGYVEIAYVDRPHLAKTIRVWRFKDGKLEPVADLPGFTNHRIGERDIAGGIRTCAGAPEMIVASADWARLIAVRLEGGRFSTTDIGPHKGRASFARAMKC